MTDINNNKKIKTNLKKKNEKTHHCTYCET